MNWRGTPLVDLATIASLIGSTHSRAGLHVRAELDRGRYRRALSAEGTGRRSAPNRLAGPGAQSKNITSTS